MSKDAYRQASFLVSAANIKQLPPDEGYEVAFSGCSNAGKSSTLNALTDQKSLAKTSKTPGRTQLLNFFTLDDKRRLVDLPGFGYAKVAPKVREAWQRNIDRYLRERNCLRGIVLVSDIRHPLKQFECDMMAWASTARIPLLLILNKSDKLSRNGANKTFLEVKKHSECYEGDISVCQFSAIKRDGLDAVCEILDSWFAW